MLNCTFVNSLPPIRFRSVGEPATQISWWKILFAVAVMSATLLSGLGVLGLMGPDEPRYAAIAREMLRTGDWVTPRLYGHSWFEKPVLYYWAAGSAFRLFGVSEFAARLPNALAAFFATLLAVWAALRAFGTESAWLAAVMLPATIAMPVFGHAATTDMLFSALLMAAAVAAAEMLAKARPGRFASVAFGAFLGAAVLAKGPAALLLAGGAVLLWALASGQWRPALRFLNFPSVAVFCLVALPWYALAAARNPAFLRVFIWQQNFERYLTPVFQHRQPFWFFGVVLLGMVMPWTVLLVPLIADGWRALSNGTLRDSPGLFYASWVIFPVLFFSFSASKLPAYVLPSVPPLVLLLAANTAQRLAVKGRAYRLWAVLATCTLVGAALAANHWVHRQTISPGIEEMSGVKVLFLLALGGGVLCAALAITRNARAGIAAMAALVAVLVVAAILLVLPAVDPLLSPRSLAAAVPEQMRKSPDLYDYYAGSPWIYGLEFYLDRELVPWSPGAKFPLWEWTTASIAAGYLRENPQCSVIARPVAGPWLLRLE